MAKKYNVKAIIYDKRGRILSIGENSYLKSHPLQAHYSEKVGMPDKIFLHAEVHAIVKCRDLDKAHRIEVIRLGKDGKERLAKPCKICMAAIKNETNIKEIVWTVG